MPQRISNVLSEPGGHPPLGSPTIVLHTCCAPCGGGIIATLTEQKTPFIVYFYNPNIAPFAEYEKRRDTLFNYLAKMQIPFAEGAYEHDRWLDLVHGFEQEPERGRRCQLCFQMRWQATAEFARQTGAHALATTIGISRWKNLEDINQQARLVSQAYPELSFLTPNWRKNGGTEKMRAVQKTANFYQQRTCGCEFSGNLSTQRI